MTKPKNVGHVDVAKRTSSLNGPNDQEAPEREEIVCYFNGAAYSVGSQVCSDGNLLRCSPDGSWTVVGTC